MYDNQLRSNSNFRRRICYCDAEDLIIVQYLGDYDFEILNKNQTNPKTMNKIKDLCPEKPTKIYAQLIEDGEEDISLKQIYNLKNRKVEMASNKAYNSQMPEEYIELQNLVDNDEFVQEYSKSKNNHPTLVLFKDEQIQDMKSMIRSKEDIVIGIDRTFNLSFYYATIIVYKNLKVRNSRGEHPIFLGPVFLHRESKFSQYSHFLSTVKTALNLESETVKFESIYLDDVSIGSDQELALTKAINNIFPSSIKLNCYLHIRDNLQRKMVDIGISKLERKLIVDKIFGDEGILLEKDYDKREVKISRLETMSAQSTKLAKYINDFMKPIFIAGKCTNVNGSLWTNNNSESMNNVIKQETNWKIQTIPQLITVLKGIVERQHFDLKASIYGSGNFSLTDIYKRYKVPNSKWKLLRDESKQKYFRMLLEYSKNHGRNEDLIQKRLKGVAKKPNQSRRIASERVNKSKKLK